VNVLALSNDGLGLDAGVLIFEEKHRRKNVLPRRVRDDDEGLGEQSLWKGRISEPP
jgi:hypothetical protein